MLANIAAQFVTTANLLGHSHPPKGKRLAKQSLNQNVNGDSELAAFATYGPTNICKKVPNKVKKP